jgi:hypothetical protein
MRPSPHITPALSRRDFLTRTGFGFGGIAASYMLGAEGFRTARAKVHLDPLNPLTPRPPHHTPRAQSVIFLFMEGGPSHLDLFDPKPELDRLAGSRCPPPTGKPITAMGTASNTILPSKRAFKQHGEKQHLGLRLAPVHCRTRR